MKYKNMTFVWTEMSFLSMWYDQAHDIRRKNLKQLIDEGRFEVLTGGWVMTDEANVDIFAMVDQLVEGHQWLKNTLGVVPKPALLRTMEGGEVSYSTLHKFNFQYEKLICVSALMAVCVPVLIGWMRRR